MVKWIEEMNEENINAVNSDVWKKAKRIYLSTLDSEDEISQTERYFSMITSVELIDDKYIFNTANAFCADILEKEYRDRIKSCLKLALGNSESDFEIQFNFEPDVEQSIVIPVSPETTPSNESLPTKSETAKQIFESAIPLNPEYTFEKFIQGPSNSLALATATCVAENPGDIGYNPFFIYGGSGLGKTHLMQAIGNALHKRNPNLVICYITAETFINEFVNALSQKEPELFRQKYRNIDVILMDDIQFIAGRSHFQEEFFNTFCTLYGNNKQIVMTSDVSPRKLMNFEERLISRFEGGMVQEIELPSYETRLAILRKKTESIRQNIPDAALRFIAENIKSHVRAMEGALSKVKMMMANNPHQTINDNVMRRLLGEAIEKENKIKKITIQEIQEAVCKKYNVSLAQIMSAERTANIVTPRQLAMYIARKYSSKGLPDIAKMFGRTHATILHGVKAIEKRLDDDEDLKSALNEILSQFSHSLVDKLD